MTAKQSNSLQKTCLATANLSNSQELCEFFDLFFVCETTAKQLIQYSKNSQRRGNSKPVEYPNEYTVTEIRSAVRYFRIPITSIIVDKIFKSGSYDGRKTCRKLRNMYVHKVPTDKDEIENRFEELKGYMEQWIDMFS